jgi:exodeoxyribonuclease V alpha subunit
MSAAVPDSAAGRVPDSADWRRATSATGMLRVFNEAGALETADVLVAQRLTQLAGEADERVTLAIAFVVRAVRGGSVCLDLAAVAGQVGSPELPWPDPARWLAAVAGSALVSGPTVLHLDGADGTGLLYLDRYWIEECRVAADVRALETRASEETAWILHELRRLTQAVDALRMSVDALAVQTHRL